MKKYLIAGLLSLFAMPFVASAQLAPSPSPCDVVGTPFLQVTENITNDPDSGNFGNWATDAFTENISAWVGTDGTTNCANASVSNGTFVTTGGVSPEMGTSTAPGITGTFTGGENYTLGATIDPSMSTTTLTTAILPDSSTDNFQAWVAHYFVSSNVNTYSLTYVTPNNGMWTDADSRSGGDQGDITGDIYVAPVVPTPTLVVTQNVGGGGAPVGLLGTVNTNPNGPSFGAPQIAGSSDVVATSTVSLTPAEQIQETLITALQQLIALLTQELTLVSSK